MHRRNIIQGLGLTALVAATLSFGHDNAAFAAPAQNNNTVRSNRGGITEEASATGGGGSGKASFQDMHFTAMGATLTELEALLATLTEQMTQLEALNATAQEQGQQVATEEAASSEASAEELARLDEVKKTFDEQVAGELDSSVAETVTASLEAAQAEAAEGAEAEVGTLSGDLEALSSLIGLLQEAIDEAKSSSSAVKAGYDVVANKKV